MHRDYSEKTFFELTRQIQDINNSDFCFITDGIQDIWNTFSSWIGWLDIEDYVDNISAYHKRVLDQHNTTSEKLKKIFEEVRNVDAEYADHLNAAFQSLYKFRQVITSMSDLIAPQTYSFDLNNIKAQSSQLLKEIEEAKTSLDSAKKDMANALTADLAKKIGKELLLDVADCMIAYGAFMAKPSINNGWQFINTLIGQTFSDLEAIFYVGSTKVIGDERYLKQAESMKERDDFADVLVDEFILPEEVDALIQSADAMQDAISVFNDAKDFVKNIGNTTNVLANDIISDDMKWAHLLNAFVGKTGFSAATGDANTFLGEIKNQTALLKNVKNVYSWVESAVQGELTEKIISKSDIAGITKDTQDFMDEMGEIFTPWLNKALA